MDIGSLYSDYLTSTATKAGNLERTLKGNDFRKSDDELMAVCKEFEAYFYEQVFKSMEKAMVPSNESEDAANGTLVDYYKEQLIGEYSKSAVEQSGSNSLAQQLYEQMKRNEAVSFSEAAETVPVSEAAETVPVSEEAETASVSGIANSED